MGFVKGKRISKNVFLAQEIIRDIKKRNKLQNVMVKLDMLKAHVRVSWKYLIEVIRRFDFSKRIIDMIVRLISNNWYSVLMNGKSFGFFLSSRGLKQGDPLSPTLFIIAPEVLARNLNGLYEDADFKDFGLPKWSPHINHLSYASDTILFYSGQPKSIRMIMKVLRRYETMFGQMFNIDKSICYLHRRFPQQCAI